MIDPSDKTFLYVRVGYDARMLSLRRDGKIEGGGEREAFWTLSNDPHEASLCLYGQDAAVTAILHGTSNGQWGGAWTDFEKMPVTMRPARLQNGELLAVSRDFSQYGEQHFILEFFNGRRNGIFLDIGAADGVTDSNTRALAMLGWEGTLVEPVPEEFWRLEDQYADFSGTTLINAAVAPADGYGQMWIARQVDVEAYRHGDNRHTMVSEVMELAINAEARQAQYDKREVRTISPKSLRNRVKHVDFLSVDAEGLDGWIIKSMLDLGLCPQLVVFEADKTAAVDPRTALTRRGYEEVFQTSANSLWARPVTRQD